MFMQRNRARQGEAVSLGILTDTIAATGAAETAERCRSAPPDS